MDHFQQDLDFDGTDVELQNRLRWAENAARERAFWTPERVCLSWMQGTTPDESDMRWWAAQPSYRRKGWLDLLERERKRMRERGEFRRPFHIVSAEHDEWIDHLLAQDEKRIERYMEILREDFMAGRPCSLSFDSPNIEPRLRDEGLRLLREAMSRLAVPESCFQPRPLTESHHGKTNRRSRSQKTKNPPTQP